MKEAIISFVHELIVYDYILFAIIFLLFLLLLLFAVALRHKTTLAMFIFTLAILFLFIAPFIGYTQLDNFLYKRTCKLTQVKQLKFSPALLVQGTLTNKSNREFNKCTITANIYKVTHNAILNHLYALNPFQKMSIVQHNLMVKDARDIQMIIQPFYYKHDYNVSLTSVCR